MLTDVVNELLKIKGKLDEATQAVEDADRSLVDFKKAYTVDYARAYLNAKGTVAEREAQATLATEDALFNKEVQEVTLRAKRERLRTLRDQMEILRSISSAEKAQFVTEATGQWT